jgi:hypothetical protein
VLLRKIEALEQMLSRMNVPEDRRVVTLFNAQWLLNNIGEMNYNHPEVGDAQKLLREIVYRVS